VSINNQCYLQVLTLFKKEKTGREDLDLKTSVVGPYPGLFDQVGSGYVIIDNIGSRSEPESGSDLFDSEICRIFLRTSLHNGTNRL
jgi:hypothetical protein